MHYETSKDLAREKEVLDILCKRWKCNYFKLPSRYYDIDYALLRDGKLRCFVEIKTRSNAQGAYPTAVVGFRKVNLGLMLAERAGVPFYLVYRWTDAIGYTGAFKGDILYGERCDRGDDQDADLWMHIPIGQFVNL